LLGVDDGSYFLEDTGLSFSSFDSPTTFSLSGELFSGFFCDFSIAF
jgi:hypothetical protein